MHGSLDQPRQDQAQVHCNVAELIHLDGLDDVIAGLERIDHHVRDDPDHKCQCRHAKAQCQTHTRHDTELEAWHQPEQHDRRIGSDGVVKEHFT